MVQGGYLSAPHASPIARGDTAGVVEIWRNYDFAVCVCAYIFLINSICENNIIRKNGHRSRAPPAGGGAVCRPRSCVLRLLSKRR
jgi:hypothetical protein